jgi:hypothetical protein
MIITLLKLTYLVCRRVVKKIDEKKNSWCEKRDVCEDEIITLDQESVNNELLNSSEKKYFFFFFALVITHHSYISPLKLNSRLEELLLLHLWPHKIHSKQNERKKAIGNRGCVVNHLLRSVMTSKCRNSLHFYLSLQLAIKINYSISILILLLSLNQKKNTHQLKLQQQSFRFHDAHKWESIKSSFTTFLSIHSILYVNNQS